KDQRPGDACRLLVEDPDRPRVGSRQGTDAVQEVVALARVRARNLFPAFPVPMQDQRALVVATEIASDGPRVSRSSGAHSEEEIPSEWVTRARNVLPPCAVPVEHKRVSI